MRGYALSAMPAFLAPYTQGLAAEESRGHQACEA